MPSSLSSGKRSMKMSAAGQTPSTSDPESKSRNQIRRRIQLACTRCRRRKIRCSGETHDGAACTNCKAAGSNDCRFLRPETTPVLPAPGSALAFPYPSMAPLVTSASSDSFGGRIHQQQAVSSNMSPPMYAVAYPRTQSLSDLGNYNRVDSLQRESPYANDLPEEIYSASYSLHSIPTISTSDTMADYYGPLGSPKAWNNAAAVAMAADLARSQSAVFYAADVPSLFPTGNLLSPGDLPTSRVLPTPTSSGLVTVGSSNTTYLRDIEMVATSGLSEPFSNAFGGVNSSSHDDDHHQNYMMRYTAMTTDDSSMDTLPITSSSTFTRSNTSDSSDMEEPLMMSMNGLKNGAVNDDKSRNGYHHHHHHHNNNKQSATYGYRSRARPTRMRQASSAMYNNASGSLLQSSIPQGISLGHTRGHQEY